MAFGSMIIEQLNLLLKLSSVTDLLRFRPRLVANEGTSEAFREEHEPLRVEIAYPEQAAEMTQWSHGTNDPFRSLLCQASLIRRKRNQVRVLERGGVSLAQILTACGDCL